jgi:hypothetical protein
MHKLNAFLCSETSTARRDLGLECAILVTLVEADIGDEFGGRKKSQCEREKERTCLRGDAGDHANEYICACFEGSTSQEPRGDVPTEKTPGVTSVSRNHHRNHFKPVDLFSNVYFWDSQPGHYLTNLWQARVE